jgi:hypothetical protein
VIRDNAFYECTELRVVTGGDSLIRIEVNAFAYSGLVSFAFPASLEVIEPFAFNGCHIRNFSLPPDSLLMILGECAFSGSSLEQAMIPWQVKEIGANCFGGCTKLNFVEFEEDSCLVKIGEDAFAKTSIREITIPKSVKTLGAFCFVGCRNLTKVTFEAKSELEEIGACAFAGSGLRAFEIPRSVKKLGAGCFSAGCKVSSSLA